MRGWRGCHNSIARKIWSRLVLYYVLIYHEIKKHSSTTRLFPLRDWDTQILSWRNQIRRTILVVLLDIYTSSYSICRLPDLHLHIRKRSSQEIPQLKNRKSQIYLKNRVDLLYDTIICTILQNHRSNEQKSAKINRWFGRASQSLCLPPVFLLPKK